MRLLKPTWQLNPCLFDNVHISVYGDLRWTAVEQELRLRSGAYVTSILIIDDSPDVRRCMRRFLEEQPDWKVCGEAENGREGILKARQLKPDIILMDLSMPVMNGLEAARELKRVMPKVLLVMWTLAPTTMIEQEAFAAGISLVCTKLDAGPPLIEGIQKLLKAS